jgi:hypothetical protein
MKSKMLNELPRHLCLGYGIPKKDKKRTKIKVKRLKIRTSCGKG